MSQLNLGDVFSVLKQLGSTFIPTWLAGLTVLEEEAVRFIMDRNGSCDPNSPDDGFLKTYNYSDAAYDAWRNGCLRVRKMRNL